MSFTRGANPIWSFVDLTGAQLDDTYYMNYLSNVSPYLPQNVYHDPDGITPWANPLQFLANGTLPDNVYGIEGVAYRLQVRQGPLSSDPLIYSIDNYFFENGSGGGSTEVATQSNQITNPQFITVNFGYIPSNSTINPSILFSSAGTYNIAPGWQLILGGSGTCTVTRINTAANQAQPSDNVPPYYLNINSNGWSSVILEQVFNNTGSLWVNNYLSVAINALSESGFAQLVSINYVPSGSSPVPLVSSVPLSISNFAVIQGSTGSVIPPSTSTALNSASSVAIQIVLPGTSIVDISDVQVVASATAFPSPFVLTPDDSLERQEDHFFHYYGNELIIKPKKSILSGWIFSQNPYQFINPALTTVTAKCSYIADQTILYQNIGSQVQSGINPTTAFRNCLTIKAVAGSTDNRFAIIQYLDYLTIRPYWGYLVSALARARIVLGSGNNTQVRVKMRLIATGLPPLDIGNSEPIASWAPNSDPVFSSAWTEISVPLNDPAWILANNGDSQGTSNTIPPIPFNSIPLGDQGSSSQYLGVVFYTMDQMGSVSGHLDEIIIDRISLVPNEFAVDSNPVTFDETLRELQYYYEMSYEVGFLPGSITSVGEQIAPQTIYADNFSPTGNEFLYPKSFYLQYKQTKCKIPSFTFYSPSGLISHISAGIFTNGSPATVSAGSNPTDLPVSSFWSASTTAGLNSACLICINTSVSGGIMEVLAADTHIGDEGFIQFHYTLDSRLGVNNP